MEAAQAWRHWTQGTYVAHRPSHRTGPKVFLAGLVDKKVRSVWRSYWRAVARRPLLLLSPIYTQSIGIIQAPDMLSDGRVDMCDSCPDMCVHDGTLVNSCRWDEWRLYGGYLHPQLQTEVEDHAIIGEELEWVPEKA
jgi:hypothetical protein